MLKESQYIKSNIFINLCSKREVEFKPFFVDSDSN